MPPFATLRKQAAEGNSIVHLARQNAGRNMKLLLHLDPAADGQGLQAELFDEGVETWPLARRQSSLRINQPSGTLKLEFFSQHLHHGVVRRLLGSLQRFF